MKKTIFAVIATGLTLASFSQDSTQKDRADTIKIGGMIIIKNGDKSDTTKDRRITISNSNRNKNANVQTNWLIVDLGFANYNDNTNYLNAGSTGFTGTGVGKDQLEVRTGKSVNVNIWAFMQKLNIAKHVLNLKYGLGVELNNYRFDDEWVQLFEDPTRIVLNEEWKDLK